MADNFPLTTGSGRYAATDQVTYSGDTADVQLFRMIGVTGTEGSKTVIEDGTYFLGRIGSSGSQIDITIATAAAAYSSGDMVGAEVVITGAARVNGGTGKITGVRVEDDAVQSVAGELWISDTAVTEPADNAAWSISDADAANNVTVLPFSAYYASALNSIAPIANLSIPFKCTASVKDLYLCMVTRGAPTYTANAIHIRIWVDQD